MKAWCLVADNDTDTRADIRGEIDQVSDFTAVKVSRWHQLPSIVITSTQFEIWKLLEK